LAAGLFPSGTYGGLQASDKQFIHTVKGGKLVDFCFQTCERIGNVRFMNLATKIKTALAFLCMTAVFGCGGGSCPGDSDSSANNFELITMTGIEPCVVAPGSTVRVYGSFVPPVETFRFAPSNPATVTSQTASHADLVVPAGVVSGSLTASRSMPNGFGSTSYTVGTLVSVAEVEPNEAIDGSNATPVGNNRTATGNLANPGDADHFRFGCVQNKQLRVTLNPPLVGNVFVNGTSVMLTAGSGTFTATTSEIVVGLVGGTGDYTLTITPA
jgi:hypothetical protein